MRQTIGISLALLVISTGAIAKTPEKARSHDTGHAHGPKPSRAETHCVKTRSGSAASTHHQQSHRSTSARHRYHASDLADDGGAGPDVYWPTAHAIGSAEYGKAAWYDHVGGLTSSGERLDTVTATAAHRTLPLASFAKVTHLDTGRSVIVKINDRGPQTRRFIIDLSPRAADELNMKHAGVAPVVVEPVAFGPEPTVKAVPAVATGSSGISR
jgi:rare lipoprotein A (peptidoglycan hydrolase)